MLLLLSSFGETHQNTRRVHSIDLVIAIVPVQLWLLLLQSDVVFIGQCNYCKEENHRISNCAMKKAKDARDA